MSELELVEEFEQIDTDHDGRITFEELSGFLKTLGPQWEKLKESLYKKMDKNEDGEINQDEYLEFMKAKEEGKDLHDMFKMLDIDESGVVSVAELNHILTETGIFLKDDEVFCIVHLRI